MSSIHSVITKGAKDPGKLAYWHGMSRDYRAWLFYRGNAYEDHAGWRFAALWQVRKHSGI